MEVKNLDTLVLAVMCANQDQLLSRPRYADPRSLVRHRSRVYSQNGEDGAIAEIFRRIGIAEQTFMEIGAGDGDENCTRFLLEQGWSGRWAECDPQNVARIRAGYAAELARGQLVLVEQPIDAENAARLFPALPATQLDLLSIDIDMNTSHVWRALGALRPRVAVIEYNASIPPSVEWEVPYEAGAAWQEDNYYGASLKRLERIGRELGMRLVGCELTGVNAFFVREDLASEARFLTPFTAEFHHEPQRCLPPVGFPARPRARMAPKLVAAA